MLRRTDRTPSQCSVFEAMRRSRAEFTIVGIVLVWIAFGAGLDSQAGVWRQRLVGLLTWALLVAILRRQPRSVRVQVAVVIVIATCVEYTASPLLGLYTYRLHNVPSYVPPGHGLVYLAALNIGRSALAARLRLPLIGFALVVCGAWAVWGAAFAPRQDMLGLVMYLFLVRFILVGRQPLVYAGAFLVCSYLELIGTGVGAWRWATHDPTGVLTIGNPPSGIPGGYCFLDAFGIAMAPRVLAWIDRRPPVLAWLRPLPDDAG
jgi:hypothetical protein